MLKKREGFDNDAWLQDHFEMIVDKYGGKYPYVLVAGRRVFPVKSSKELPKLEARLRKEYGTTLGMPVPRPDDFLSVLFAKRLKKV